MVGKSLGIEQPLAALVAPGGMEIEHIPDKASPKPGAAFNLRIDRLVPERLVLFGIVLDMRGRTVQGKVGIHTIFADPEGQSRQ